MCFEGSVCHAVTRSHSDLICLLFLSCAKQTAIRFDYYCYLKRRREIRAMEASRVKMRGAVYCTVNISPEEEILTGRSQIIHLSKISTKTYFVSKKRSCAANMTGGCCKFSHDTYSQRLCPAWIGCV